ncbi:MAG: hypothetical protein BWK78_04275, partial [Thiotrichaceae bacterium IS1]
EVHAIAVAFALCIGFLLYRYIELPIRHAEIKISRKLVGATISVSLTLALTPFWITLAHSSTVDYTQVRRVNHGFGVACEFNQDFTPKAECRNSEKPTLLVWGDSFAMHLVPGIIATTDAGVVQATRSVCGPFIGMAPIDNITYTRSWAKLCLAFNQSVFDYLSATPSIKTVVLSSPFEQFLSTGDNTRSWRSLKIVGGQLVEQEPTVYGAVEAMRKTVEKLRELGKQVVIVAPPPMSGFDSGRCLERKATGLLILGVISDCNIPISDYHKKQELVLDFLQQVQRELVPVVYFDEILCSKLSCSTLLDGKFVYRDSGHLSYDGSQIVAKKMKLGDLLQTVAR